jgi:WD40 repeat protein
MAAAEPLARAQNGQLLVGPVLKGWIGLYLNDSLSSEGFAAEISKAVDTVVLDLVVHDSDIFIYNFYKQGRLIDEYSSSPDYFEQVSEAEHSRLHGKPEVFWELLGSDEKVNGLRSLLSSKDKEKFLFEENRLEKFAELLGIKNTLSSYQYLTNGEWDGIEGRKQFDHIPDLTAEKAGARAAASTLRAEMKRLQRDGTLCFESLPPGKSAFVPGEAMFDPLRGGVLFRWGIHAGYAAGPKLFHARPPWTSEPEVVDIPGSSLAPSALVFSRTGKLFAYFEDKLRVCDWGEKRSLHKISIESTPVQFSDDEKRLLCSTKQGFEVLSIENGKIIQNAPAGAEHPQFLAWHPAGRFVVTRHRQDQLGLIDLEGGELIKVLYSGTIVDWSKLASVFSGTLKQARLSDEQLVEMKQGFIRGSDEPFSLKFSPDGRLLFCGTTRGLRVLEWEKVLAAEKSTPAPLFAASPMPLESPLKPSEQRDYVNFIYDVEFDQIRNRLLFCGIEGTIRFFNLNDGSTGILLKPPGSNYIWRLVLSPDREHICCVCTPSTEDRNKKPNRIQVWNYRILRTAASLD